MRIFQALADAGVYRTMAIIPEQVMFGLTLARDPDLRTSAETRRNLELGREFCEVIRGLYETGSQFRPRSRTAATISAGASELKKVDLERWNREIGSVYHTIDALLAGSEPPPKDEELEKATEVFQRFAAFAKQTLSTTRDAENIQPRALVEWH